jgi:dephospho-CoA kinase
MGKGRPVYEQVVEHFGEEILSASGEIDRVQLGKRVFADSQERVALNRLVHPAVIKGAQAWIGACREAQEDAVVLVPLLFESGWTKGWDAIICVTAPEEQIFKRLENRGFSKEEAIKRIESQMSLIEKATLSDFVIENGGTLESLRRQVCDLVEVIRCEKRKSYE